MIQGYKEWGNDKISEKDVNHGRLWKQISTLPAKAPACKESSWVWVFAHLTNASKKVHCQLPECSSFVAPDFWLSPALGVAFS